jgi:hypothetical protein
MPVVLECETQAWMKFLDTTTPLIGPDGEPKAECFIPGNNHMLPTGYGVWKSVIALVVVPVERRFEKSMYQYATPILHRGGSLTGRMPGVQQAVAGASMTISELVFRLAEMK